MFGYSSSTEYYKDVCLSRCLKDTSIFTICVNADDDPCYSKEVSFDINHSVLKVYKLKSKKAV